MITVTNQVDSAYRAVQIEVLRDTAWNDAFHLQDDGGQPADLVGAVIELYVRPAYEHPTLFRKLTSANEIIVADRASALLNIVVPQSAVRAAFPVGRWVHFCRVVYPDGDVWEAFRGDFLAFGGLPA